MEAQEPVVVFQPEGKRQKRLLFLGYGRDRTGIIDALLESGCEVHHTDEKVTDTDYDLIVSFGYRHIINGETIRRTNCPILNLHISFLPYNRGAHPNFWSFFDGTPAGVTIHLIDEGIDTGAIVFQKYVTFSETEITFAQTHRRLVDEIEALFIEKIPQILAGEWQAQPQKGSGTVHRLKDLPEDFSGWNSVIEDEIKRLRKLLGTDNA